MLLFYHRPIQSGSNSTSNHKYCELLWATTWKRCGLDVFEGVELILNLFTNSMESRAYCPTFNNFCDHGLHSYTYCLCLNLTLNICYFNFFCHYSYLSCLIEHARFYISYEVQICWGFVGRLEHLVVCFEWYFWHIIKTT